jgi:hypothetical protein
VNAAVKLVEFALAMVRFCPSNCVPFPEVSPEISAVWPAVKLLAAVNVTTFDVTEYAVIEAVSGYAANIFAALGPTIQIRPRESAAI